ncbi:hypothetical protein J6590_104284 [Homalodisca vitripennis]|nr:hypothetical protein J6590_104284 [Homalodisca vitripennis]
MREALHSAKTWRKVHGAGGTPECPHFELPQKSKYNIGSCFYPSQTSNYSIKADVYCERQQN